MIKSLIEKPRRLIKAPGGQVLLGGISYWIDGELKQAAVYVPEGEDPESQLDKLIELEKRHGVWPTS